MSRRKNKKSKKKRETIRRKEKMSKLDRQLAELKVKTYDNSWFWCEKLGQKKPIGACANNCNKRCKYKKIMTEYWKRHYAEISRGCPGNMLPMKVEESKTVYDRKKERTLPEYWKSRQMEERSDDKEGEDEKKAEGTKKSTEPVHIFLKAQDK